MTAIAAIAIFSVFTCRVFHPPGFLACDRAITAIQDEKITTFLPKVRVQEVSQLQARGVVLVNARLRADFQRGHLESAINLPPSSSLDRCRKALTGISAADRVVLYCRCDKCPFAAIVARKLSRCGLINIALLERGWLAWDEYHTHSMGTASP